MSGFRLYTNVISETVRPTPMLARSHASAADESLIFISVLTLGEIRKSIDAVQRPERRARLESWLQTALRPRFAGRILPVGEEVAEEWGRVATRPGPA